MSMSRRTFLPLTLAGITAFAAGHAAASPTVLRLSAAASETDQRATAILNVFAPAVSGFATLEPHWSSSLVKQGTELDAISRGELEMAITSAQELAAFIPEFSVFAAGYLHRDAEHQLSVFNAPLMDSFKTRTEKTLNVKLLTVMYLGKRHLNLRIDKTIMTPADLAGVKLRMPGSDAWQFLGKALGADPVPLPFKDVYAALESGTIDAQDNPLPTNKDAKFHEVTKQIVLTSHLVDFNYLAISKKVWDGFSPDQQETMQKAADAAAESGRQKQLALEDELVQFFKDHKLRVYEPDIEAFRTHVLTNYLESDFSKSWPSGLVDKIAAA